MLMTLTIIVGKKLHTVKTKIHQQCYLGIKVFFRNVNIVIKSALIGPLAVKDNVNRPNRPAGSERQRQSAQSARWQ